VYKTAFTIYYCHLLRHGRPDDLLPNELCFSRKTLIASSITFRRSMKSLRDLWDYKYEGMILYCRLLSMIFIRTLLSEIDYVIHTLCHYFIVVIFWLLYCLAFFSCFCNVFYCKRVRQTLTYSLKTDFGQKHTTILYKNTDKKTVRSTVQYA